MLDGCRQIGGIEIDREMESHEQGHAYGYIRIGREIAINLEGKEVVSFVEKEKRHMKTSKHFTEN